MPPFAVLTPLSFGLLCLLLIMVGLATRFCILRLPRKIVLLLGIAGASGILAALATTTSLPQAQEVSAQLALLKARLLAGKELFAEQAAALQVEATRMQEQQRALAELKEKISQMELKVAPLPVLRSTFKRLSVERQNLEDSTFEYGKVCQTSPLPLMESVNKLKVEIALVDKEIAELKARR